MSKDQDAATEMSSVIELSKQGHALLKAQRFAEAHSVFQKALTLDPKNPYVLTGMGDLLRQKKDFPGAEQYYLQVLSRDPHNLFSLRGLGDTLRGQYRFKEAIHYWELYLNEHHQTDIFVLTRIADGYKTLDDYEHSLTYYQRALGLRPNDRYALIGLADLYRKKGLDELAIQQYEKAVANGVTMVSILTIVANLYWKQNNFEKAKSYYKMALQQEPHNFHALYGLGNYYRIMHNYQLAVELWEQIVANNAGTVNLLARLGDAYRNLGRLDDAERTYCKGLERGYDKFTLAGMMKLHCQTGRLQDACTCYDELLSNEGEDSRFFAEASQLLLQHGCRDMALDFLRHVAEVQTHSPAICHMVHENISHLLAEQDSSEPK
ncbi:MAG: tetratricopeptide repeat protein [Desulfuromonadaceae bacterium]|nr:tetratricopeptide repeat protein [Desulfuromonadaceae bacterium]MDD5104928.1 tetratricopeptide repeat protein [Desulfuromonadaceae bacterium]